MHTRRKPDASIRTVFLQSPLSFPEGLHLIPITMSRYQTTEAKFICVVNMHTMYYSIAPHAFDTINRLTLVDRRKKNVFLMN